MVQCFVWLRLAMKGLKVYCFTEISMFWKKQMDFMGALQNSALLMSAAVLFCTHYWSNKLGSLLRF